MGIAGSGDVRLDCFKEPEGASGDNFGVVVGDLDGNGDMKTCCTQERRLEEVAKE